MRAHTQAKKSDAHATRTTPSVASLAASQRTHNTHPFKRGEVLIKLGGALFAVDRHKRLEAVTVHAQVARAVDAQSLVMHLRAAELQWGWP